MNHAPAREKSRRRWLLIPIAALYLVLAYGAGGLLLVHHFLWEAFFNSGGSMMPALLPGDYFFVSRTAYPHRYPLPEPFPVLLPASPPGRGDVAAFKLPSDDRTDYVKRIVGLPGDRVQMRGGVLHLNGEAVKRERIEDLAVQTGQGDEQRLRQYVETLPDGRSHRIIEVGDAQPLVDDTAVFLVPPGHLFVLGDNRDNSQDSRFINQVGYVPMENLIGRAAVVFFSADGTARWWEFWRWSSAIRYGRLFKAIQ